MNPRSILVILFTLVLCAVFGGLVYAAPLSTQFNSRATPTPLPLTVTPSTVRPGQTIHVSVAGLAGLPSAGKTGCLGVLGPGQNVERHLTPQFRPQIGTMAVGTNGSGQTDAQVPANLVGGSYQVIFGGCSPHGNIAPLATIARVTITVIGSTTVPIPIAKLPATGGAPPIVAALAVAIGLGLASLGITLKRAKREAFDG